MTLNRSLWVAVVCLLWPTLASAQLLSVPPDPAERAWEVAVQAGAGTITSPSGTGILPPLGNTISIGGSSTTRQVPSWFFGDGTDLMNSYLSRTLFSNRISPLNDVLTSTAQIGSGLTVSGSLTRRLTSRLALEFGVSMAPDSLRLADSARPQLENSTHSFETAFNGLMQLLAAENSWTIGAEFTVDEPSGMHVMAGGGIRFLFTDRGPTKPFVTAGVGMSTGGDIITTVTGRYDFLRRTSPLPRIQETDTVTIRHHADSSWYTSFGIGLTRDIGQRYGIRAEVAVNLLSDPVHISIDAVPSRLITEPTGAAVLTGNPGLIFSTVTGISTNLSHEVRDFETFSGDGLRVATRATAGMFFRF